MDSDEGKLFVGGVSWETTEDKLKEHFSNYGEVLDAVIMRDKTTGRPRGFGFVAFAEPSLLDRVLQDKHTIDGRNVEVKRALSREEQQTSNRSGNATAGRAIGGGGGGGNMRTKKIFVGGLPPTLTEEGFRQYFESYGTVTDAVVMYDQSTHRPRGFGFISFDSEDTVDKVLHKTFHDLNGKPVEVKRALPKDANSNTGMRSMGGGSYQSYGGATGNSGSYDGRPETNRYMQPQGGGGGYPAYGSSGYGAPAYGYGTANNGVPYAGYGVGGYGAGAAGYNGPAGAYGNPAAATAGYVGGPPGAQRNLWGGQAPAGYGYGGSAAYGPASSWNASAAGGGTGAAPTGQGYGYGVYGGPEGSYGNQGNYGSAGGRGTGGPGNPASNAGEQGGSGYMSGGYGDTNGNSGYSNAWRSDPSSGGGPYGPQVNSPPGAPATYGGGYGGHPGRQAQQQ